MWAMSFFGRLIPRPAVLVTAEPPWKSAYAGLSDSLISVIIISFLIFLIVGAESDDFL